jgi:acyl-CoA synthetase (AMP-forming)/AMP-acid ligase II
MSRKIPEALPGLLRRTADRFPSHGIGHIRPGQPLRFQTYPQLLEHATALLAGFQKKGISRGDKVILSLENSGEIIPVLWACFLGGIIPALLQPPVSFTDHNPAAEKAGKVFRLLGDPWVILSHRHFGSWMKSGISSGHLIDISGVELDAGPPTQFDIDSGDLALIQFSSGSTGDPKGVMLTHDNIRWNIEDIVRGIRLLPDDISVNWLPLYHDMGLIGFHITPLQVGVTQYFTEPADFVKNPALWLDALSELKCTITACPNFGQILLNRYLVRKAQGKWDFSSIRVLFNGAEPISVPAMQEFSRLLEPYGFQPQAMFPAYGMAEATLAVTFGPLGSGAHAVPFQREALLGANLAIPAGPSEPHPVWLVDLGQPLSLNEIRVVDERQHPVEENHVGHIQVKGRNVTGGYFNNPGETALALSGGWLRTGDMGFIHKGNLFVTGRMKDIIFVNGINLYAHDLEQMALQIEGLSPGKIVISGCFSEQEGKDQVIVFLVTAGNDPGMDLCRKIRRHFQTTLGLFIDTFVLIRSTDIPRTSSGKIQRHKLVNRFLMGEFRIVRL